MSWLHSRPRLRRFLFWVGLLPWLMFYPLTDVSLLLFGVVSPARAGSVLVAAAWGLVAGAALAALLPVRLGGRLRRAVLVAAVANVFLIAPLVLQPAHAMGGLAVSWGLLALVSWRLWRFQEETIDLTMRLFAGAGSLGVLAALLATPWIAWAWAEDWRETARWDAWGAVPEKRVDSPRRILLLTFDSLASRYTSLDPDGPATTPRLLALAERSHWFTGCRAASDRTRASLPTLLSGMPTYEIQRRVRNASGLLRPGRLRSVAGWLQRAGYRTSFATVEIAPEQFGLANQFDHGWAYNAEWASVDFDWPYFMPLNWLVPGLQSMGLPVDRLSTVSALRQRHATCDVAQTTREILARGFEALSEEGPTFVWLHLYAPHTPYIDVPSDHHGPIAPGAYRRLDVDRLVSASTPGQLAECRRVYEAYVRYADGEVGAFFDRLRAADLWEDTLVAVTSDHGEGLSATHRWHARGAMPEEVAHVPLVIKLPNQRTGVRHDAVCGHSDLVPTLLGKVWRESLRRLHGRDLLGVPAERPVIGWAMSLPRGAGRGAKAGGTVVAYVSRFKYTRSEPSGREALFDLKADPEETLDIRSQHPAVFQRLRSHVAKETGLPLPTLSRPGS